MERFGWEIVKQTMNSLEVTSDHEFCNELKRGYKDGWLSYFSEEIHLEYFYSLEEHINYVPQEENPRPGYELESQAYKLGYTLAVNDCLNLDQLGEKLSTKLNKSFESLK